MLTVCVHGLTCVVLLAFSNDFDVSCARGAA